MTDPLNEKARYYERAGVVDKYDTWRFGSEGGRYVHDREADTVLAWHREVSPGAQVLDMPVGTGRLASLLVERGFTAVHGADLSGPMLAASARNTGGRIRLTRQNAFRTAFAPGTFDVIISLRFFFHFAELDPLLAELRRIVAPRGLLIFDTLRWSPRAIAPPLQSKLGGRVYCHPDREVARRLEANGFAVRSTERLFLFPSLVYRFVPAPLMPLLRSIDQRTPNALRSKTLWLANRSDE